MVDASNPDNNISYPTDRKYWLIIALRGKGKEPKYFVSNASASIPLEQILTVAFARWQIEMWFRSAKQEAGVGAFEVRTYTSLMRHWLSARMAMYFLAAQTTRLRGEQSEDHSGSGRGRVKPVGNTDLEPCLEFRLCAS